MLTLIQQACVFQEAGEIAAAFKKRMTYRICALSLCIAMSAGWERRWLYRCRRGVNDHLFRLRTATMPPVVPLPTRSVRCAARFSSGAM